MNVLILGSGGREHAFAWKIAQSKHLGNLYIAPGNAGTANCGTNVSLSPTDFEDIKKFVWENSIDLVLVGPEEPLVKGIHDFFEKDVILKDVSLIGPKKEGAILEGSKDFSKQFMARHGIPTARFSTFTKDSVNQGFVFLESLPSPYVLKADGLAAGKGVLIIEDLNEAKAELHKVLTEGKFGEAGNKVVVEEFLSGIECSVFVLTDGVSYKILPSAKDYKRIGEGDTGLNTGGMGAVSPVPFADNEFMTKVEQRIIVPTIEGLKKDNISYTGFIFIGLMNVNGNPYVIEYNCRMGDPETEVVIPRIKSDFLELLIATGEKRLSEAQFLIDDRVLSTVIMVSGGYPGDYEKGHEVSGLNETEGSIVFHSGTKNDNNNKVITSGGRVFAVTSYGKTIEDAVSKSIQNAYNIKFHNSYFRRDIGKDLL
ncbi:MAG: phosphoribosylamine--glycine ligase [Bacteroidota bacterium]|jgi:phosphoribosylamine--glycine ligase